LTAGEEQFLWIYSDRDQNKVCLPYPLSIVFSNDFHFYGVNEDVVEKFNEEQQEDAVNGAKKRKNRRDQIEVPGVAIKHKDDPSITISCGDGIQITKTNFGQRQFFIVAILWSSTCNFSFLLVEKDLFYDLEEAAVDKTSGDGLSPIAFPPIKQFVCFFSSAGLQSQASRFGGFLVALLYN